MISACHKPTKRGRSGFDSPSESNIYEFMSLSIAQIPDSSFFFFFEAYRISNHSLSSYFFLFLAYYWGKFCERISEGKIGKARYRGGCRWSGFRADRGECFQQASLKPLTCLPFKDFVDAS